MRVGSNSLIRSHQSTASGPRKKIKKVEPKKKAEVKKKGEEAKAKKKAHVKTKADNADFEVEDGEPLKKAIVPLLFSAVKARRKYPFAHACSCYSSKKHHFVKLPPIDLSLVHRTMLQLLWNVFAYSDLQAAGHDYVQGCTIPCKQCWKTFTLVNEFHVSYVYKYNVQHLTTHLIRAMTIPSQWGQISSVDLLQGTYLLGVHEVTKGIWQEATWQVRDFPGEGSEHYGSCSPQNNRNGRDRKTQLKF
ncbi:hypothetical protein B0H10DRAFT_1950237 [Mycena sp. CBHHK59/15]|nr:hypothetical protein B0H10DRAFT_1950237 [Mycena sp. CBHHK59/15]